MDLDSNRLVSHSLDSLGWNSFFERQRAALAEPFEPARVSAGGRGILQVFTAAGPRRAKVSGRLLHESDGAALPAVGDWVGIRPDAADPAVITHVFARRTALLRKAAGRRFEAQVLAANVNTVMIVSSLNADFNPRRLERYLEVAIEGGARPVFVLNKADLCDAPERFVEAARALAPSAPVIAVSATEGAGLDALAAHVRAGETLVLLGSSGVGKSTIANRLLGNDAQRAGEIRAHDDRGKHTTTHRELFVLPNGGLLVDTPGLRELEPWDLDEGGPAGFGDVEELAAECRFRDCAHEGEPGCAVAEAVERGALEEGRLAGFRKLAAEGRHLREKHDARARAEARRRGKMIARITKMSPKS
ncbi:ribosome small subunit-dependent GTPase A [Polyangium sorediatum]|uniref:Small ribosomal subunit biogenesis GTPase RsgA n=1 Tax=Polyangium sorediatum TaxID=889274 RepID=A0ABT6NU60_9BACT|nr:ribosome small subunit-dependent GTPase A [Polyangium sorediatum]MDI1431687.1 ribosome small subunit-dependent GTPase A [Polyangium sorediatum]